MSGFVTNAHRCERISYDVVVRTVAGSREMGENKKVVWGTAAGCGVINQSGGVWGLFQDILQINGTLMS